MSGTLDRVLSAARLPDIVPLMRRVAGLRYLKDNDFLPEISREEADRLTTLSARARGDGPAPILILGVMPRSGTNYVRDLLALHPDVHADPGRIYEFPLLHAGRGAAAFMDEFISYFPRNEEVTTRWDALALLAGAWLREFQAEAGDKRVLLKCPHVQNLALAPYIFPGAKVVLCVRDGRDVVDSSLRTFGGRSLARKTFTQLAWEWRHGTEAILSFAPGGENFHPDMHLVRYESLVDASTNEVETLLTDLNLDPARYDHDAARALPVRGSSRSQAKDTERWQGEARSDGFKSVGRWEDWPTRRRGKFLKIAGDVLARCGYDAG